MAVDIQEQVSEYFHNAQLNAAGHRKLIHALRKLHLDSSEVGSQGEQEFFLALIHCLNVLLSVRKNEETVTRCIRFLVGFIVCSAERDEASILGGSTPTTRLIENIMLYALEGVDTKERLVRVRLTQVLVACVNAMDELSDAVWSVFRVKMTERLFDREAAVRIQAVHAMARLQGLPLTESSGGLSVRDVFLELLAHDPVAEVRKAVLGQIDVMEDTLGAILLRRRDVDASIRKFFYSRKMSEIDVRVLSMKQRDEVLRSGLTDRDGTVRRTCIEMVFGRWIQSADNNLIQLLISLDVIGHTKVAEYALRAFYEMVPEMFSSFPPAFFENLTPETAISLRVYCERAGTELLPEMSELAEHIRRIYETILSSGGEGDEGYRTEAEFILCELFKVASTYDGSDEMGRRVVQDVLLEILSNLELGDGVFTEALTLLSKRSGDLGEFLQVVGQLVTDLHELYSVPTTGLDEQLQRSLEALTLAGGSGASPLPEDIRIIAQLRCLEIVSVALQLPSISLNKHPAILSLTSDVVIPSVNSPYAVIQSKGLLCLGLVCTLSLDLSCEYLDLLIDFFQQGQDDTRLTALKILFDLTFVFGDERLIMTLNEKCVCALYDEDPAVQAGAAEGYAKLLLHRILHDPAIITGLLHLYFSPSTATNPRLRQTLTYFLQAFAYSSSTNQSLLAKSTLPILQANNHTTDGTLTFNQIAGQLIELTDPARLVATTHDDESNNDNDNDKQNAHAELAEELAWAALRSAREPEGRQFASLLGKLSTVDWPIRSLKRLLFVVGQLIKVTTDRVVLTGLKKLVALLVELDDPTVLLEAEDLIDLREKMTCVEMPEKSVKPLKQTTTTSSRPIKPSTLSTVNIMEEIDDLLD